MSPVYCVIYILLAGSQLSGKLTSHYSQKLNAVSCRFNSCWNPAVIIILYLGESQNKKEQEGRNISKYFWENVRSASVLQSAFMVDGSFLLCVLLIFLILKAKDFFQNNNRKKPKPSRFAHQHDCSLSLRSSTLHSTVHSYYLDLHLQNVKGPLLFMYRVLCLSGVCEQFSDINQQE